MDATQLFDGFDAAQYEDEARERFGGSPRYAQAQERTARYRPEDWAALQAESDGISRELAALLTAGEPADGAAAIALAERHRAHITRWFYDCPSDVHAGLGELYAQDPRFARWWERHATGLAAYARDAFAAAAARAQRS